MSLKLPHHKLLSTVHPWEKRDRIPYKIGLVQCANSRRDRERGLRSTLPRHNDAGGMMTKGVSNMVKSSKLGAVTQGR